MTTAACQCEQDVHFADSEWHRYGAEATGQHKSPVGPVCDDCARTHYRDVVETFPVDTPIHDIADRDNPCFCGQPDCPDSGGLG